MDKLRSDDADYSVFAKNRGAPWDPWRWEIDSVRAIADFLSNHGGR
jgi:hypothetical protein